MTDLFQYRGLVLSLQNEKIFMMLSDVVSSDGVFLSSDYFYEQYQEVLRFCETYDYTFEDLLDSWKCNDCDEQFVGDSYMHDSNRLCENCYEEYSVCSKCGKTFNQSELIYIDAAEIYVCDDCLDNYFTKCTNCGEYHYSSSMIHDDYSAYCSNCYDEFLTCDDCGRITHRDNINYCENTDEYYCDECYPSHCVNENLHDYNYMPSLNFKGDGNLYFGTEIEIDYGRMDDFKFEELSDIFYCKTDGSLDEGFEIVSHPMTYDWIMENTPYKNPIALAKEAGFKSHNTSTCGLHIHMSRKAFGNTEDEQEQRITSFIYFFEKFWNEIVKFSRRDPTGHGITSYAQRFCDTGETPSIKVVDEAKKKKRFSRYHCVNVSNYNTVEVRIFRGTLVENTIIASIQLCKLFYELSVFDVPVLENMTWNEIKRYAEPDYPELMKAFEERKL